MTRKYDETMNLSCISCSYHQIMHGMHGHEIKMQNQELVLYDCQHMCDVP
uniref:Uncharacterized protein n=1 Tax=Arundo donax TaxID=35708 RepID=A0A0A8ZHC8_ARUDO